MRRHDLAKIVAFNWHSRAGALGATLPSASKWRPINEPKPRDVFVRRFRTTNTVRQ